MDMKENLQKTAAVVQSLLGQYQVLAESTEDQALKSMFQSMAEDMTRHGNQLQSRVDFLTNREQQPQS